MKKIKVRIIYALPDIQRYFNVELEQGSTVLQAIEKSNLLQYYPELDLHSSKVGVYSNLVSLDYVVNDGDRIEIYRPLVADPKALRQKRAMRAIEEGRASKKTGSKIGKS